MMGALGLLRKRSWRMGRAGWWSVTVLTVVITAVSLASVAGARRTLDAYPSVLARLGIADVQVGMGNPDDPASLDGADLLELPGVEAVGVLRFHLAGLVDEEGQLDPTSELGVVTPADDVIWRDVERPLLLEGRLPEADDAGAVALTERLARRLGAEVGDRVRFGLLTLDEIDVLLTGDLSVGARPEVEVVGIVQPTDFSGNPDAPFATDAIMASAAFAQAHPGTSTFRLGHLRLTEGADGVPALARALEARVGAGPDLGVRAETVEEVERAVRPEVVALGLLGLLTALGGVVVVGQAVGRQFAQDREANEVLAALGLSRRGRIAALISIAVISLAPGVGLGTVVALVASTLAPVGLVRPLERSWSMRFDAAVHVGGAAFLLAVLAATTSGLAWRHSTLVVPARAARPSLLARTLSGARPPWNVAAAVASVPGATRRHVRSLAVGLGAAVAVLVVVGTFTESSERLQSTPELYGQRFDLAVWDGYGAVAGEDIESVLAAEPAVADFGEVASTSAAIDGEQAQLHGFGLPHLGATVVAGRLPAGESEVVLGLRLAGRLGAEIGDDVQVVVGERAGSATVVGIGAISSDQDLAAALTLDGLRRLVPGIGAGWRHAELADGASPREVQASVLSGLDDCAVDCDVVTPTPPAAISHLGRTGSVPVLLGAVAAVGGLLAGLQGMVALVRRNRFDVALLRALGATGQAAARLPVAQTAYATGTAVVVGVLCGLVAGRSVWTATAERLGVVTSHATPVAALSGVVAAILVTGHLAGRFAARRLAANTIAAELARRR